MSANKTQIGGKHYKTGGLEHWDLITFFNVGYLEGCATKYVARHRSKNGKQDLLKAQHFVTKLRELVNENAVVVPPRGRASDAACARFARDSQLTNLETQFVTLLCQWQWDEDLEIAELLLKQMIRES